MRANHRQIELLDQRDRKEPPAPAEGDDRTESAQLRRLGVVAAAEATTLLLLVGVAVPLKHFEGWPLAVRILGPVHGFAFVAYLWLILQSLGANLLSRGEAVRLALCAFIPLAGYLVAHNLAGRSAERSGHGPRV